MSQLLRRESGLLVFLAALIAGCGVSSPTQLDLTRTLCQRRIDCGEISASARADCEASNTDLHSAPVLVDYTEALAAGRAALDADRASRCIDQLKQALCVQLNSVLVRCRAAYLPQVAEGGACKNGFECTSGHCSGPADGCAGTCKPKIPTGSSCDPSYRECAPGDRCDCAATPCSCRPRLSAGSACTGADDCEPGLVCTGLPGGAHTCRESAGVGEECPSISVNECAADLYCDRGASATCQPAVGPHDSCLYDKACPPGFGCVGVPPSVACLPLLAPGDACEPSYVTLGGCARDGICDPMTRTCVSPAASAEPCDASHPCNSFTSCSGGRCKLASPPGGPCTSADSRSCQQGVCNAANQCVPCRVVSGRSCVPLC